MSLSERTERALEQRDREIANSATFRKSLYDYDVENAAIACRSEKRSPNNG
jgi:salicylate hydroxylase